MEEFDWLPGHHPGRRAALDYSSDRFYCHSELGPIGMVKMKLLELTCLTRIEQRTR